ncbi:MAG: hypothetical protein KJO23_07725, partial [Bacteroidia bacterium]|nr:hypothetical protein [Bacteroidia bacterium]
MKKTVFLIAIIIVCAAFTTASLYPIDGYEYTGIKRLKRLELVKSGELKDGTILPPGAMKSYSEIQLNLAVRKDDSLSQLLQVDKAFQEEIG